MPELNVVKKSQRGACLSVIFSFKSNTNDANGTAIHSTVYDIDELAKLQFTFKYFAERNGTLEVSIRHSLMKKQIDCPVKMKVVCKALNYSKEFICSEDWSYFRQIGFHRGLHPIHLNIIQKDGISFTEIIIFVYKWTRIGFEMLYNDSDFTDFTLEAADGSIVVHKACLAAHCDALRSMLTGPWVEAKKDCIQMKDVAKETLEDLKEFIYLGGLPEATRLRNLLVLACRYFMDRLKEECIRKLVFTVPPEELNSLHTLACMYNIPQLSVAISQWTPDDVIDKAYEIEKKLKQTELK